MQKQTFVFATRSTSSQRASRPSPFTLFALTILATGLLILGIGLVLLLLAPLLIATGATLVTFALLVGVMILLVRVLRWALARILESLRQTTFAQALSPALHTLLRQLVRQLVAFLLDWLEQSSDSYASRTNRRGHHSRSKRSRLALAVT